MKNLILKGDKSKPLKLVDSDDKLIIRLKANIALEEALMDHEYYKSIKHKLSEIAHFPEANAYVLAIKGANKNECLQIRNKLRSTLKKVEQVDYAGRLMQYENNGLYQIYTENIFIKFKDHLSEADCHSIIQKHHLLLKEIKLNFSKNAFFVESLKKGQVIFDIAEQLHALPEVEYCQPELISKRKQLKSDLDKYYFDVTLNTNWSLDLIDAKAAWKKSKGKGVKICVIDDGIDLKHKAFENKILFSKDMLDKKGERKAVHRFNEEGHGTACASIAVANDKYLKGVAPEAKLIVIRSKGLGSVLEAEAFYEAVKAGADIISCSWGPPDGNITDPNDNEIYYPIPDHTSLAIEYAAKKGRDGKGCTILFAAGNGNEKIKFDGYASHPEVLAIASVNKNLKSTIYTDYGAPLFCVFPSGDFEFDQQQNPINQTGVVVADRTGSPGYAAGDYFDLFTGTSASCPGVAGVIALMLESDPDLKATEIRQILINSCVKIGNANAYDSRNYSQQFGHGLVNAAKAIHETGLLKKSKKPNKMNKGNVYAMHIGVNTLDRTYYSERVKDLSGCVNDMRNMAKMVKAKHGNKLAEQIKLYSDFNDEVEERLPKRETILANLRRLAQKLNPGDFFILTYAGHGGPVPDKNGDEKDKKDEAWVCYDGILIDDYVESALANFKEGVKILLIFDCCHSGSISRQINFEDLQKKKEEPENTRYISRELIEQTLKENNEFKFLNTRSALSLDLKPKASILALAACGDEQFAQEEVENGKMEGVFSLKMRKLFESNPKVTYSELMSQVRAQMPSTQTPQFDDENLKDSSFIQNWFLDDQNESYQDLNNQLYQDEDELENVPSFTNTGLNIKKIKQESSEHAKDCNCDENGRAIPQHRRNEWEEAHRLLSNMRDDELSEIDFIEPNITSNIYYDQETHNRGSNTDNKKYLKTYPSPENDFEEKFIWHLSDEYSQLRAAFNKIFETELLYEEEPKKRKKIKVAHIDTGIFNGHPLLPKYFDNTNLEEIEDIDKNDVIEQQGHGQATISILAGNKYESPDGTFSDYYGANPFARVKTYRISDKVSLLNGKKFKEAVYDAVDNGYEVITMSMAGIPDNEMADAVNYAYNNGVVIVSAASNNFVKGAGRILPKTTLYPARWDRVIAAVGATFDDTPYLFYEQERNRGLDSKYMQMCYGPAEVLPTTVAAYTPNITWFGHKNADEYSVRGGGTSSATPQIAAAASLYIAKYKNDLEKIVKRYPNKKWIKAEIIRQAIFRSCQSGQYDHYFGNGILKALKLTTDKNLAPKKLISSILKAKKAKNKGGFIWNAFKALFGRSARGQAPKRMVLEMGMFNQEIIQLLYKDPELYKYQHLSYNEKSMSKATWKRLISAIQASSFASQDLKSALTKVGFMQEGYLQNGASFLNTGSNVLRGNNLQILNERVSTERQNYYNTELEIISVEAEIQSMGLRSMQDAGIHIDTKSLSSKSKDDLEAVYIEINDGEESVGYWEFGKEIDKQGTRGFNNTRAINQGLYCNINQIINFDHSSSRSGEAKTIKFLSKLFKWKGKVLAEETVKKIIEQENYVVFYDLKKGIFIDKSREDYEEKAAQIWKRIEKNQDELLILFHGLFSSVQDGFKEFLDPHHYKLATYGRYAIGFNSADVIEGIAKNAEYMFSEINAHLSSKKCTIIARSRGCAVARYFLETLPFKNFFELDKFIQIAPPNQGTQIANDEIYQKTLNALSILAHSVFGLTAPIVRGAFFILKKLAGEITALPGIDNLEIESEFMQQLNSNYQVPDNYFVIISNYEPKGLVKKVLDQILFDKFIFKGVSNDGVVPTHSAYFSDHSIYQNRLLLVPEKLGVGHFGYLKEKVGKKKKKVKNPIPNQIFDWLEINKIT